MYGRDEVASDGWVDTNVEVVGASYIVMRCAFLIVSVVSCAGETFGRAILWLGVLWGESSGNGSVVTWIKLYFSARIIVSMFSIAGKTKSNHEGTGYFGPGLVIRVHKSSIDRFGPTIRVKDE